MALPKKETTFRYWSNEEDKILRDTVLDSIRKGDTIQNAFKTVASQIDRTHTSIAFRWSSKIRKTCLDEIKSIRGKDSLTIPKQMENNSDATSQNILDYFSQLKTDITSIESQLKSNITEQKKLLESIQLISSKLP